MFLTLSLWPQQSNESKSLWDESLQFLWCFYNLNAWNMCQIKHIDMNITLRRKVVLEMGVNRSCAHPFVTIHFIEWTYRSQGIFIMMHRHIDKDWYQSPTNIWPIMIDNCHLNMQYMSQYFFLSDTWKTDYSNVCCMWLFTSPYWGNVIMLLKSSLVSLGQQIRDYSFTADSAQISWLLGPWRVPS